MIRRPADTNPFEFAVVSGLRAAQLMRGCIPRVERAEKVIITAQMEGRPGGSRASVWASSFPNRSKPPLSGHALLDMLRFAARRPGGAVFFARSPRV
jgi:hypothetical protein